LKLDGFIEAMLLGISELKESQKKTDEQTRRTDTKLDRIGKQLANLGLVKEDVRRYAEKAGLYVMTQTDEGGAALLNRDDFEPKEFS